MKHEGLFSRIVSSIFGDKIAIRENLFYNTAKFPADFADDDLPNWQSVKAEIANTLLPVELSYGIGTVLPISLTAFQTLYSDYGRFPNIRVVQDGGLTNPNPYLTGFTISTTEAIPNLPDVVTIDDGSGALAYNIIVIISSE